MLKWLRVLSHLSERALADLAHMWFDVGVSCNVLFESYVTGESFLTNITPK